jgi:hypothetical protein
VAATSSVDTLGTLCMDRSLTRERSLTRSSQSYRRKLQSRLLILLLGRHGLLSRALLRYTIPPNGSNVILSVFLVFYYG